ncbi:STAS domain-containing protein [Rhodococcus sp. 14C212]|uniref:STAS domain-containing protein n=1 Tax=Rhodococcus sp. 14C212 TaxID=2711209 RepID=UPI0013ED80A5|nr:STAS domain-containing protein [Rhodococcus sp. 14C212]NGP08349.1 STAS domain-containing protein [Rhodococcus sp. 14C212]
MVLLYSHTDGDARVFRVDFSVPEQATFEISVDRSGAGAVVVRVCGDVDITTAPLLDCVLQQRFSGRGVVVDLLQVDFFGCAGLTVLESAACGTGLGGPVIAAVAVGEVRHALQVTGIDRVLPCCADLGRAVELVGRRRRRVAVGPGVGAGVQREDLPRNPASG